MNRSFSKCSIRVKLILIFNAPCFFKTSKAKRKFTSIPPPCVPNINAASKATARAWKPFAANWVSPFTASSSTSRWIWRCMIFSAAAAGVANEFAATRDNFQDQPKPHEKSKLQAPTFKLQRNSKHQVPKLGRGRFEIGRAHV